MIWVALLLELSWNTTYGVYLGSLDGKFHRLGLGLGQAPIPSLILLHSLSFNIFGYAEAQKQLILLGYRQLLLLQFQFVP